MSSVFKDISALDYDYQPSESPVRRKELQRLLKIFEPVITSHESQAAIIQGPVGSGKTELVRRFSKLFQKHAIENGSNVHFEFINCRRGYTNGAVMLKILNRFQPDYGDSGHSMNRMFKMLIGELSRTKVHIIIVLDEADILLEKYDSKLIHQLTMSNDKGMVSLILISQKEVMDMLNLSLLNTFRQGNVIHLNKFSREEILAVLNQRVKLAFHKDIVEMGVAELISDIASGWGDVRYAIELLERSGMIAVEQNAEKVTVEHVRAAKAETYATVTEGKLKALNLNQKMILLAIARCLREKAYTTIDEAEKSYREVCKEFGEEELIHTKFLEEIKEKGMCGIIGIREPKGEITDKTTISLYDIPAFDLSDKILYFIAK